MNLIFLIFAYSQYGFHEINQCISSIRQFHQNEIIYIVDGFSSNIEFSTNYKNIVYFNALDNVREFGSISYFMEKNIDFNYILILHDSSLLLKKITINLDKSCYLFWKTFSNDWSPAMNYFIQFLQILNIEFNNQIFNGTNGLMGIFSKPLLKKIFDLENIKKIKILTKSHAVSSELLLGYLIQCYFKEEIFFLYDQTLHFSMTNNDQNNYVAKLSGGKGPSPVIGSHLIKKESYMHPEYPLNEIIKGKKYNNFLEYNQINCQFDFETNYYNYCYMINKKLLQDFISAWPNNILFEDINITLTSNNANFAKLSSYFYFNY